MAKIMLNGVNYSGGNQINEKLHLVSDVSCQIAASNLADNVLKPLQIFGEPIILNSDISNICLQVKRGTEFKGGAYIQFDTNDNGYSGLKITKSTITGYKADFYDVKSYGVSTNMFSADYITSSSHSVTIGTNIIPSSSDKFTLGNSSSKWKQLFACTSVISTSDRNVKKDIKDLDDKWVDFFMLLQPKSYLFKDGESGRTHVGFISQDVEDALEACGMSPLDFAGFCKDQKIERITEIEKITQPVNAETGESEWIENKEIIKENPVFDKDGNPVYIYSLRYEEFIALNTMMIQKLYTKNKDFEERLSKLEQVLINY